MRQVFKLLFAFSIILLLTACEMDKCFKKAGDLRIETTEFDSISMVHIHGIFNVELVQDTVYYVETEAYEQVLRGVELKNEDNILSCYNYNSCFWRRDFETPTIRVHFSDINELNIFEASYIYSDIPITDNFRFTVRTDIAEADLLFDCEHIHFVIYKTCGGRYNFKGKTNSAYLANYNAGLFDMSELVCITANVQNNTVIDMKVNVTDQLKVQIHNSGNILYLGNPTVVIDSVSSTGRAIPMVR